MIQYSSRAHERVGREQEWVMMSINRTAELKVGLPLENLTLKIVYL